MQTAAVVGLGRMGMLHLDVLRDLGLDVVGGADGREEARAAAVAWGIPADRVFADAAALLDRVTPDVMVIATTAPSHADLTCLAADRGVGAVLCEKPMATSIADCRRMIVACETAGTRLAINHQMRFMPLYTEVKGLADSPMFGGIRSVNVLAGNFGFAMNGSHYFEMFRYIVDEMPVRVWAWLSPEKLSNPRGAEFEDVGGCVRLETASGHRFYMDCSVDQGHGMHVSYGARLGFIDVDEIAGHVRMSAREPDYRDLPTVRYAMPSEVSEKQLEQMEARAPTAKVLEALLAGDDYPDGEIGEMTIRILVAAVVSHERGGSGIDLDPDSDRLPVDRLFSWA